MVAYVAAAAEVREVACPAMGLVAPPPGFDVGGAPVPDPVPEVGGH